MSKDLKKLVFQLTQHVKPFSWVVELEKSWVKSWHKSFQTVWLTKLFTYFTYFSGEMDAKYFSQSLNLTVSLLSATVWQEAQDVNWMVAVNDLWDWRDSQSDSRLMLRNVSAQPKKNLTLRADKMLGETASRRKWCAWVALLSFTF